MQGGEKTNAKNRIMLCSMLIIGMSMFATSIAPASAATVNINSGMTNSDIQNALNNAGAGDTVKFLGTLYTNIQLTITKTLNIVTSAGTVLSGANSPGSAVFLINGPQASGTTISGFTINASSGSGVIVNNANNVVISNDSISAISGTAVAVNQGNNTVIKNDTITQTTTGISISNSKNTHITESTVKNSKGNGIDVENSVNTTINKDKITNNVERGIKIYNSVNTTVDSSTVDSNGNNSTAGPYSTGGGIYVQSSKNVKITHNSVTHNSHGIVGADSSGVTINNNTIEDSYGDGIALHGSAINITIDTNTIKRNSNGLELDYSSGRNINIKRNTITGNTHEQKLDDRETEEAGNGINYGRNYMNVAGETVEHNVIMGNKGRDINGHDADYADTLPVGPNWYGVTWSGDSPGYAVGNDLFCCKVKGTPIILKLVISGENTYTAYLEDVYGNKITDLPDIDVIFSTDGGFFKTMTIHNGQASVHVGITQMGSGVVWASSGDVVAYVPFDDPITPINPPTPTPTPTPSPSNPGTPGSGPGSGPSGPGTGTGVSGSSSGSTSGSGTSSGPSASTGLAAAAAAGGSTGSNAQDGSHGKTAQELFVDKTVKNPEFWGILGIIVLIVLIFGAYYRKDLMAMVKKSKK